MEDESAWYLAAHWGEESDGELGEREEGFYTDWDKGVTQAMKFPAKRSTCPGKKAWESTACVKISSISLSAEWKQILRDGTGQEWGYEGNVTLRIFEFSPNVHADFCFRSISDGSDKARSMRGKVASPEGRRPQRQEIGLPWGGALGKRQQGRGQTQKIFRSKSGQILWQTVCEREMDYGRKKGKEAKRVG